MKYLINIVIVLVLLFVVSVVSAWQSNNKKSSEKLKIAVINAISSLPVILLSSGILFVIFQVILHSLNINKFFLDVLIVSIYGALIIYSGDYISKPILRKISYKNFSRVYGGKTLTEEEMEEIYKKYKKSFLIWNYTLKFLISGLLYSLISDIILSGSNLLAINLMSLTSIIFYGTIFKKII